MSDSGRGLQGFAPCGRRRWRPWTPRPLSDECALCRQAVACRSSARLQRHGCGLDTGSFHIRLEGRDAVSRDPAPAVSGGGHYRRPAAALAASPLAPVFMSFTYLPSTVRHLPLDPTAIAATTTRKTAVIPTTASMTPQSTVTPRVMRATAQDAFHYAAAVPCPFISGRTVIRRL
jgi:hypothetical protein